MLCFRGGSAAGSLWIEGFWTGPQRWQADCWALQRSQLQMKRRSVRGEASRGRRQGGGVKGEASRGRRRARTWRWSASEGGARTSEDVAKPCSHDGYGGCCGASAGLGGAPIGASEGTGGAESMSVRRPSAPGLREPACSCSVHTRDRTRPLTVRCATKSSPSPRCSVLRP